MGSDLMPLALVAKLLGGLALCFGLLVAAAWSLRRQWPRFKAGRGRESKPEPGMQVLQTRGLGPGAALHLVEVDGARLLVLQSKDRSDVVWSRDERPLGQAFESAGGEAALDMDDTLLGAPDILASYLPQTPAAPAAPGGADSAPLPPPSAPAQPSAEGQLRRALELQRERQRRYRERHRQAASSPQLLRFPLRPGTRP